MTTVGVKSSTKNPKIPCNIPSYAYKYPCSSRVKFSATKHGIFNPFLPSFRTVDRDKHMNKLPYEHCQTSTGFDFNGNTCSLRKFEVQKKLYSSSSDINETRKLWNTFLDEVPERFEMRLPMLQENKGDLHFSGYNVKYLRPSVSQPHFKLTENGGLDNFGRKPISALRFNYRENEKKAVGKPWKNP